MSCTYKYPVRSVEMTNKWCVAVPVPVYVHIVLRSFEMVRFGPQFLPLYRAGCPATVLSPPYFVGAVGVATNTDTHDSNPIERVHGNRTCCCVASTWLNDGGTLGEGFLGVRFLFLHHSYAVKTSSLLGFLLVLFFISTAGFVNASCCALALYTILYRYVCN